MSPQLMSPGLSRLTKRLIFFFLGTLIVFVLTFPRDFIARRIISDAAELAKQNGIYLKSSSQKALGLTHYAYKNLTIMVPVAMSSAGNIPMPIVFDSLTLQISKLSLLSLSPRVSLNFLAYAGTGAIDFDYRILQKALATELRLDKLQFANHIAFKLLGITGKLTAAGHGTLSNIPPSDKGINLPYVNNAQLAVELHDAASIYPHKLYNIVDLPPISNLNLIAQLSKNKDSLTLDRFELSSSLLNASFTGNARISVFGVIENLEIKGDLLLAEDAVKLYSGYLALAANLPPSTASRSWQIAVQGDRIENLKLTVKVISEGN